MTSPEGMTCLYCSAGEYREGTTTMTLERPADVTLVVKNVPAHVCWACGDALLDEEVSERLDAMMDAAEAAGGTTVREYEPTQAVA